MKRTWPLTAPLVLSVALLAGCSAGGPAPGATGSPDGAGSANAASASAAAGDQAPSAADAAGSGAGVDSVDTSKVLAEQVYKIPGTQDSTTFGVLSLKVQGKVMVLKMAMTPDFASMSQSDTVSVFKMAGRHTMWPRLVDRDNLKEYSIVDAHRWATNAVSTETGNGEPAVWWGVYAAPEDDIDAVDIQVLDGMPAFTNVPIQR